MIKYRKPYDKPNYDPSMIIINTQFGNFELSFEYNHNNFESCASCEISSLIYRVITLDIGLPISKPDCDYFFEISRSTVQKAVIKSLAYDKKQGRSFKFTSLKYKRSNNQLLKGVR